jgi:hypothetical protein
MGDDCQSPLGVRHKSELALMIRDVELTLGNQTIRPT